MENCRIRALTADSITAIEPLFSAIFWPLKMYTPTQPPATRCYSGALTHVCVTMKQTKKSQPERKRADLALSRVRSAVTNGSELLAGCDHRSARMRKLKDLIGGHVADLGGRDLLSQAEFCLVRRCALLTLELELLEARFEINEGAKAAELECYQRTASSLRRLLESLGLKRRQRDVGPSLGEILHDGHRGRVVDAEVVR